jgi:hypothetical protein
MNSFTTIAVICLFLVGCQSPEQIAAMRAAAFQARMDESRAACTASGIVPNTPKFEECMRQAEERRLEIDERNAAASLGSGLALQQSFRPDNVCPPTLPGDVSTCISR